MGPAMTDQCRFCSNTVKPFMSFGKMPRASGFLTKCEFDEELFFEMKPALCSQCKLFQLVDIPEASRIFHNAYPHLTSSSNAVVKHFNNLAQLVREKFLKMDNPFVVEIGSNDGSMLKTFMESGIRHLGVEPALDIANIASANGINTMIEFFDADVAKTIRKDFGAADVVIGTNVIAHIPDIRAVGEGVRHLLKDDGIFIFEAVYLGDLIKHTSYSQIYDEHVFNFSVESVRNVFNEFDLKLFDVEKINVQGGSIRCYLGPVGLKDSSSRLAEILNEERCTGLNDPETMHEFRSRCEISRDSLVTLVKDLRNSNKQVVGYGAATKSTIMLNYTKLGQHDLDYIVDSTPSKHGKYSPGMHIPVVSPSHFRSHYPAYAIIFPWNHFGEITQKESEYQSMGGRWILPFLSPEVR